jgi:hypothetical protein
MTFMHPENANREYLTINQALINIQIAKLLIIILLATYYINICTSLYQMLVNMKQQ